MAAKELAPLKSAVTRTPEERLAYVDKQIAEVTGQARRLKSIAIGSVIAGILIAAGIYVASLLLTGLILFFWGLPVILLGCIVAIGCARQSGKLGNRLLELSLERRGYVKESKKRPYGHAPVEAP